MRVFNSKESDWWEVRDDVKLNAAIWFKSGLLDNSILLADILYSLEGVRSLKG